MQEKSFRNHGTGEQKMRQKLLAEIPKMDVLLGKEEAAGAAARWGRGSVADALRSVTGKIRREILAGERDEIPAADDILREALRSLEGGCTPALRPVINGTGVILHTNLGRAPLSLRALEAVRDAASHYTDLEYDLTRGGRNSRQAHISKLLRLLCGAEDAIAVNNNAAAIFLSLSALARGKEVLISRGELAEIGGSFRIPEICGESGAVLREVGSTNCTRISDYRRALGENTGAVLKVHAGNYRVEGYTEAAGAAELAALSREAGIPFLYDLGSGVFAGLERYGVDEPRIPEVLREGADLVTFSADKLLGGAQAGIIAGKAELVGKMKHHPLYRVLRVDKMTLAAVEATLEEYRDPSGAVQNIPTLAMIAEPEEVLREKAERLLGMLREADPSGRLLLSAEPCSDRTGGGTAPLTDLPGYAVTVRVAVPSGNIKDETELEAALRNARYPLVSFLRQERLWISVRTLLDGDSERIAEDFRALL